MALDQKGGPPGAIFVITKCSEVAITREIKVKGKEARFKKARIGGSLA